MKKELQIIFFILFIVQTAGFSQKSNKPIIVVNQEIEIAKIERLLASQEHEIEMIKLQIEYLKNSIEQQNSLLELQITTKVDKLDSKINNYLIFGGAFVGIIVFAINFFGRKLIKKRVETLIENNATQYAERRTDEVIKQYMDEGKIEKVIKEKGEPAIEYLLKQLDKRGSYVIDGIKNRGDEAISSMLARQVATPTISLKLETAEEISNAGRSTRAREFFDLAFASRDPLIQIELYRNVLKIEPNNINALNNIGVSFTGSYNYAKAIEYFTQCLNLAPKYALAYANRANSYHLLNKFEEAMSDVEKAIALDPKLEWGYTVKGNVLTKLGRIDEAEKNFGFAITINPKSPEAYFNRGYFYEDTRKFNLSEADYKKAENLGFSNKAMLYNNFAVLFRRQKQYDTAIIYLERARKENPSYPNIDGTLALIYADKKDRENFYKYLIITLEKGCPAWNYLNDPGFDAYRNEEKLTALLATYKKRSEAQ